MGSKRIGLARTQALLQNLKRELNMNQSTLKGVKREIVVCTAAKTLTADESGSVVYWTQSSGFDITLPDAKAGMHYRFVIVAGANAEHKIVSQSADKIFGNVQLQSTTADKIAMQVIARGSAADEVRLKYHSSVTAQGGGPGDVIDLVCGEDGYWTCKAALHTNATSAASVAVLV